MMKYERYRLNMIFIIMIMIIMMKNHMINSYKTSILSSSSLSFSSVSFLPCKNQEIFINHHDDYSIRMNTMRMKTSLLSSLSSSYLGFNNNYYHQFKISLKKIRKFYKKIFMIILTTMIVMNTKIKDVYANEGMNIYVYMYAYVYMYVSFYNT